MTEYLFSDFADNPWVAAEFVENPRERGTCGVAAGEENCHDLVANDCRQSIRIAIKARLVYGHTFFVARVPCQLVDKRFRLGKLFLELRPVKSEGLFHERLDEPINDRNALPKSAKWDELAEWSLFTLAARSEEVPKYLG